MRLGQLKKLYGYIWEILEKYAIQAETLKVTETALMKKFGVNDASVLPAVIESTLMKQFGVKDISTLPRTVETTYVAYKQSFLKLQSLSKEVGECIQNHEITGNNDNDEVDWQNYYPAKITSEDAKMAEIIRGYELLRRQYVDLKLSCQNAEKKQYSQGKVAFDKDKQRYVNLSHDDFSDKFVGSVCEPLQDLLKALNGKFDYNNVNQQLSSLRLANIDDKEFLPSNYGKDSYATYFDNQSVHLPVRDTNTPEQNKKAEDFVNAYLKKSGFPETIKPNLKVLITTLTNQGMLGQTVWRVFADFFSLQGIRIANFGQDYRIHISFDEKNQLKVQAVMEQDSYNLFNGQTIDNIGSIIKMEFTIAVDVVNDAPRFTLKDKAIDCSFITPLKYSMVVAGSALKNLKSIPADKLNPLTSCIEYITKFLGYNSVEDFYVAKGGSLISATDKEIFGAAEFLTLLDLTSVDSKDSNGKKLSPEEYKFFQEINEEYKQGNINSAHISTQICKFVISILSNPDLNNTDKLRCVYWLQLARELKGSENLKDEIHSIYEGLVEKFVNTHPELLIKAAEDDPELYQEIVQPNGFFTKVLKLPDDYHAFMLSKYPSLLQGDKGSNFIKLLSNLNPQAKLQFLVKLTQNSGDIIALGSMAKSFFDKSFINYLYTAVNQGDKETLRLLDTFVTQASSDSVAYLRNPLEKVFTAYYQSLLNRPASELCDFISSIENEGSNLSERFGIEFLEQFVIRLTKLAYSDKLDEFPWALTIAVELGKILGADSALLASGQAEGLLMSLNDSAKQARTQLRAMQLEEPQSAPIEEILDLPQVESNSSNSSNSRNIPINADEELALLLAQEEEEKIEVTQAIQEAKLSVQKLKQVEEKPTVTTTSLSEKDLAISEKESRETKEPDVKVSQTPTNKQHN